MIFFPGELYTMYHCYVLLSLCCLCDGAWWEGRGCGEAGGGGCGVRVEGHRHSQAAPRALPPSRAAAATRAHFVVLANGTRMPT
jgi:hypothetical protein